MRANHSRFRPYFWWLVAISAVAAASLTPARAQSTSTGAYQDRRLPAMRSVNGDDRCALLMQWLGRMSQEGVTSAINANGQALFRDEDFVPLFGEPYDRTTAKTRKSLYDDVVSRCAKSTRPSPVDIGAPARTYAEQLKGFMPLLEGALLQPNREVSPELIIELIVTARKSREWMTSTLAGLASAPNTIATVGDLQKQLAAIDRDRGYYFYQHIGLWPSEKAYFERGLRDGTALKAAAVAESWLAGAKGSERTVAAANRFGRQIEQYADVIGTIATGRREAIVSEAFALFNEISDAALAPSLSALRQAPATLEGAARTVALAADVRRALEPLDLEKPINYLDAHEAKMIRARLIDEVKALRDRTGRTVTAERLRVLRGAQPGWNARLEATNTLADLQEPARLLRAAFSEQDTAEERTLRKVYETGLHTAAGIDLSAMKHPELIANLFFGRFRVLATNSLLDPKSARRYALEGYVVKFSEQCKAFLPPNAEQIIRIETEYLVQTLNGWEIFRMELRRDRIATGIWAAPAFFTAYTQPRPDDQLSEIEQALHAFAANPFAMTSTVQRMIQLSLDVRADLGKFLERHGCNAPVTKRFAENVLRAAEGRPPLDPVID